MKSSDPKFPDLVLPDREMMIISILEDQDPELHKYTKDELDVMGDGQLFSIYIRR